MSASESDRDQLLTQHEAQSLLEAIPARPQRQFEISDHLSAVATVLCGFGSGLLALSGHPWWAIAPALVAFFVSHHWVANRLARPNEPRLRASIVTAIFTVWLAIPIWRGIMHGDTIPFPEAWILAGLAPVAWAVFYLVLLVRR